MPQVVRTHAVRAGNFQYVRAIVAILRVAVGADILPGIPGVAIDHQRGAQGVGCAGSHHLHTSACMARIAAVEGVAAGLTENQRSHDVHGRNAVTAPRHHFFVGIVANLPVPTIHAIGRIAVSVVIIEETARPRECRQQRGQVGRCGIDAVGRHHVVGERCTPGAVGVAGHRVIDHGSVALKSPVRIAAVGRVRFEVVANWLCFVPS